AVLLLIGAERRAGQHARLAVDLVLVEPERCEPLLHRLDLARLELGGFAPRRLERFAAGDAIAEMADEQNVQIGKIVVLDDEVVLRRQERGTVAALRLQERRLDRELAR